MTFKTNAPGGVTQPPAGEARPKQSRRLLLWVVGLGAALGCDESGPRVYTAQAYQADPGCLDAYVPIGLVEARDVSSTCDAVCLRLGEGLYVSSVCAPYPAEVSLEDPADSAECRAALATFDAGAFCEDLAAADASAP